MPIGVPRLRRTRAGETAGHHRSWCADRDAVAPVAIDPVEALLDVGAGLLGQQVAWEPGRRAVAEALALCGRKMRLQTVENRVRAGTAAKRLQHHDAQRHRTSLASRARPRESASLRTWLRSKRSRGADRDARSATGDGFTRPEPVRGGRRAASERAASVRRVT